uniref:Cytochrome P450 2K1-like n=1 Tax=Maylandia zebra TaxID=106582 RepID=A0A3P9C3I8_9CICH
MGILNVFLQAFSSTFLLGALTVLLLIYLISSASFSTQDPPGPRPLPLFGNLLQMNLKRPYKTLLELSKKYGSVFTVYLGPQKVVVLAGYKTVKEALVDYDEVFGDRDPILIVHQMNHGNGVVWSNGDSWKEMRRFALTNLRDFGMGKRACEDKIIEECQYLIEVFKKFKGKISFDTNQRLSYAVSNIICSIVYGSRFEYNDPEFTSLVDRMSRGAKLLGSPSVQMYNMCPALLSWIGARKELLEMSATSSKQNLGIFSHLKETLNPQMCRGFVDAFLLRKQTLEVGISVTCQVCNCIDFCENTVKWSVQEELTRVIGDRQVQVADRKSLPFTDAVIHEIQRLSSIVPTGIPHKTTEDIIFQGHSIKKGTTVFPLLTSVLHDPKEWERPHSFYPAHFLDNEKKFAKRDAFIPFSAGRRICLGESLARMELFLFFTTLLQHFRFTPAPGVSEDELDLTPAVGFTLSPLPHKL